VSKVLNENVIKHTQVKICVWSRSFEARKICLKTETGVIIHSPDFQKRIKKNFVIWFGGS